MARTRDLEAQSVSAPQSGWGLLGKQRRVKLCAATSFLCMQGAAAIGENHGDSVTICPDKKQLRYENCYCSKLS